MAKRKSILVSLECEHPVRVVAKLIKRMPAEQPRKGWELIEHGVSDGMGGD
jgi:hypothetical protein